MKKIQLGNYDFHYVEEGAGSPVIFVHGSISDYRVWENQISTFAKHFHVIAYSRRYHFPNANPTDSTSDYTVPQHSNDLIALINALDLGAVNLVGSSYGAYACLYVALNNPELVKTLVMGEPPVIPLLVSNLNNPLQILSLIVRDFPTGKSLVQFGLKAIEPAKKQFRQGNMEEGVRLFANGVLGEGGFEKLPSEEKEKLIDNAPALKAELFVPVFPDFPEKKVAELRVPTLFVYGTKSVKFFHSISDKLHKLLPESEQFFVPDAAHDMQQDNPKAYNKKVLEFILNYN
jgi:non-heme chloroperoxidase